MKNYDPEFTDQINSSVVGLFFLVQLQLSTTYYYTDNDVPVYYDNHKYLPIGIKFQDLVVNADMSVDKVNLDFDNLDKVLSGIVLSEDVRNKVVVVYMGATLQDEESIVWDEGIIWDEGERWDRKYGVYGHVVEEIFRGFIGGWELKGDLTLTFEVNSEFIMWNKKTLRNHSPSCQWVFGGEECGYSGYETSWCDYSYDRCVALGNSSKFGGFRFLPIISEKEVWWGRTQGYTE